MQKSLAQLKFSLGFTLIELIIAIVIVAILTTIGIAGFNSASKVNAVKQQAQEIKSLARKLRTDATAAVKPAGLCQTNGVLFGTYINFSRNTNVIDYGVSCFDSTGTNDYSTHNEFNLNQGLLQGTGYTTNLTIFFSFNGNVVFYDFSAFVGRSAPIYDNLINLTNAYPSGAGNPQTFPVTVTDGTSIGNGNRQQVTFKYSGLICDERLGSGVPFPSTVCGL